jgi:hypothetical protein
VKTGFLSFEVDSGNIMTGAIATISTPVDGSGTAQEDGNGKARRDSAGNIRSFTANALRCAPPQGARLL